MPYLLSFHWGWLVGSLVLGLAMGWISVVQRGHGTSKVVARWLAVLAVVLVSIAFAHLVPGLGYWLDLGLTTCKLPPGRFGYWLDLGLIMCGSYLIGCTIGAVLRHWVVSRAQPAPSAV